MELGDADSVDDDVDACPCPNSWRQLQGGDEFVEIDETLRFEQDCDPDFDTFIAEHWGQEQEQNEERGEYCELIVPPPSGVQGQDAVADGAGGGGGGGGAGLGVEQPSPPHPPR